jgi:pilus assembly protein CpaC
MGGQTGSATAATQAAQVPPGAPVPTTPPAEPPPGAPEITPQPGLPAETPTVGSYVVPSFPNVINLLHIAGEQQVMLKVVVAEVNRSAARSIGLNFLVFNDQGQLTFGQVTGGLINTAQGGATASLTGVNLPIRLDQGRIPAALNALRSLDLARTLAEPDLVTLNGRPANFQAGGSFPVPVLSGTGLSVATGVQFVQFGVQLRFTPVITDRDRVRLNVQASVSTLDPAIGTTINVGTGGAGTQVPGLDTRNFNTTVEMREGQTLAVAGLIRNDLLSNSRRVPLLGDIPIFSRFWSVNSNENRDQELVMLVTPVLVHPLDVKQKPPLPGGDIFEPGDLEFYLLGRMESRRPYDYRSPIRNDFARMIRYRHCEDIFINGPHGYSDGK